MAQQPLSSTRSIILTAKRRQKLEYFQNSVSIGFHTLTSTTSWLLISPQNRRLESDTRRRTVLQGYWELRGKLQNLMCHGHFSRSPARTASQLPGRHPKTAPPRCNIIEENVQNTSICVRTALEPITSLLGARRRACATDQSGGRGRIVC